MLLKFGMDIFDSLELCAFWQRSNFGHFQQFFHHNFRLKWKFWILDVSSERSSSDLWKYIRFQIRKIYFFYMNKFRFFFCIFFLIQSDEQVSIFRYEIPNLTYSCLRLESLGIMEGPIVAPAWSPLNITVIWYWEV